MDRDRKEEHLMKGEKEDGSPCASKMYYTY
jgi:hypothetical protein